MKDEEKDLEKVGQTKGTKCEEKVTCTPALQVGKII